MKKYRTYDAFQKLALKILLLKAVARVPVPVTANANTKIPVDLKLQARRNTGTPIYTLIYLM